MNSRLKIDGCRVKNLQLSYTQGISNLSMQSSARCPKAFAPSVLPHHRCRTIEITGVEQTLHLSWKAHCSKSHAGIAVRSSLLICQMTRNTPLSPSIRIRGHYNLDVKQFTVCFRPVAGTFPETRQSFYLPMTKKPQAIYTASSLFWLLLVSVHFGWHIFSAQPSSDELYSNSFGFQIVAFSLLKLPYWVIGLVVILLTEFFALRRR